MTALIPLDANACRIVARAHPFSTERTERTVKAGGTIAELLAEAVPDRALHRYARVSLVSDAWAALPGEVPTVLQSPIGPLRVALGAGDRLQFPDGGLVMVDPEARDRLERALLERSQEALDAA